jgi:hypothetical protein
MGRARLDESKVIGGDFGAGGAAAFSPDAKQFNQNR